eukprot:GHUV01026272.1.p2 GENE.GHUV01026272.1~~GHUV01026272.1.p2  ORF type:complete len:104 (-),score=20.68 GHUV01026272.1:552-863(-)
MSTLWYQRVRCRARRAVVVHHIIHNLFIVVCSSPNSYMLLCWKRCMQQRMPCSNLVHTCCMVTSCKLGSTQDSYQPAVFADCHVQATVVKMHVALHLLAPQEL